MEVQFIKVNPFKRVAFDDEVGKLPREIPQQLFVAIAPPSGDPTPTLGALTSPIKRRDQLTTLTWSLAKDYSDLAQTRALAHALDVDLTLHAPYYVDFFGSQEARERSMRQIQWTGVLADGLGARLAVTHLGFYGGGNRADSLQELTEIVADLQQWLGKFSKGLVRLAVEPSGHPDVFGSREEVLELTQRVRGVMPVLNLPHLAARERSNFETADLLRPVVDEFVRASQGNLYLNFSGVEFYGPGEFRLTPIKRGQLRFDPLAEVLSDRDYGATVISSSPLLEHDAMYTKLLYERALTRRWTKRHTPPPKPAVPVAKPATPMPTFSKRPKTKAKPGAGTKKPSRGGERRDSRRRR